MVASPRLSFYPPRAVRLAVALILACSVAAVDAPSAAAQGYGWLGGLFGGGQPQGYYGAPRYPGYGDGPVRVPRRHSQRRKPPVQAKDEQTHDSGDEDSFGAPKAPPKPATVFVDVFGDSFGQLLANGLEDALADKPEVGVLHLGRGSSGLVNDAYYNWPKVIDDLLARQSKSSLGKSSLGKPGSAKADPTNTDQSEAGPPQDKPTKIDVAVMMIGSNDRQPIVQDGQKIQPGSDEWNAIYRKRVMAIAEAFQKKKIPLVWVGVPIVKSDDFADDMAALNDIYRDAAARTGATYVDTWEAFGDDDGDFSAYGPDINGQNVRLRTADGIYFTKAGGRKLAHFVEAHVRRDLDGKTPLPELPTADAPQPVPKDGKAGKPVVAMIKPEAGPIKNLGEPPATKDGRLTEVTQFKTNPDALVVNPLVKGQADPAPAGRADNFRWPTAGGTAIPPQ